MNKVGVGYTCLPLCRADGSFSGIFNLSAVFSEKKAKREPIFSPGGQLQRRRRFLFPASGGSGGGGQTLCGRRLQEMVEAPNGN